MNGLEFIGTDMNMLNKLLDDGYTLNGVFSSHLLLIKFLDGSCTGRLDFKYVDHNYTDFITAGDRTYKRSMYCGTMYVSYLSYSGISYIDDITADINLHSWDKLSNVLIEQPNTLRL